MKTTIIILIFVFQHSILLSNDFYKTADSLLKLMTLEEKISLLYATNNQGIPRLNIKPFNWHNECLHGVAHPNLPTTVFPQAIAMAATFNTSLIKQVADAISTEARILNRNGQIDLNFWSPNINIFRDPRWGRGQETYGEDPYLSSRMAVSFINGIQGNDTNNYKAFASAKHFAVHSGPEHNRLGFNSITTNRDIFETYLPAFKAAITEAKVNGIMTAYNYINGVPCSANDYLLQNILIKKWGFGGLIFSDCGAVSTIPYSYTLTPEEAVAITLKAGMNIECGNIFQEYLKKAFDSNLVSVDYLDKSIYKILISMFKIGKYDEPFSNKYDTLPDSLYLSQTHKDIAKKVATESYILLKNDKNYLPLSKDYKKLLIIGPTASDIDSYRGNYSGFPKEEYNLIQGIQDKLGSSADVYYLPLMYLPGKILEPISDKFISTNEGVAGIKGEYFDNINFEGTPRLSRIDKNIDFYWYDHSPDFQIPVDSFGVRWTGNLKVPKTGEYILTFTNDDAISLYINDSLIYKDSYDKGEHFSKVFLNLEQDSIYKFRLEYFEINGSSKVTCHIANEETGDAVLDHILEFSKNFEVIILTLGNSPLFENEAWERDTEDFFWGDRKHIELPKSQVKLINKFSNIDKPAILLLKSGSPIAVPEGENSINTILFLWYDGQEGGRATADVLFGDAVPSGKAPVSFYKSTSDLPEFTNYSMNNRTYRYFSGDVQFPFGYGLSYTSFDFNNIKLNKNIFNQCKDDSIRINFDIENRGNYKAKEVAQVYIKNLDKRFDYYNKQLKGFNKIEVNVGEIINSTINISLNEFIYFDEEKEDTRIFGGLYELQFGNSSENIIWRDTILIEECNTDVNENENIDFKISPNPASDYIIIKNSKNNHIEKFTIRDILGNIVLQTDSINDFIDIRNLSNGTYFVEIQTKNHIFTRKFIKLS